MTQPNRKRRVMFVDETMHTPNGYVPAVVTEGESGYNLMLGSGELAEPWYWGHDIGVAKGFADQANTKMGISPAEADRIVAESIGLQIQEDAVRDRHKERWERIRTGRE